MFKRKLFLLLVFFCVVFIGLNALTEEEKQEIIEDRAKEVISTIKSKNMEKLSTYVHPYSYIRFSPYSYISYSDLVFTRDQVKNILADTTKHIWGAFQGSGYPIKLTFEGYFKRFIYNKDFANAEEISYNRIIGRGNTINNCFNFYPEAIIVEYHFSGFDSKYSGMDWKSLRLVFVEIDNIWYLVGIIHDQWTI